MKILKNKLLLSVLFIILIIVIPSFIFSIYQYSTVTDEEQVIDDVYKNQLESILFSINQYSIDVANSWVNNVNEIYLSQDNTTNSSFNEFINQNDVIKQLNIQDKSNNEKVWSKLDIPDQINNSITDYLKNNPEEIDELNSLIQNNYQKILGANTDYLPQLTFLIFRLKPEINSGLGIITINTEQFIQEVLSPKIQQIAEDKMNIVVYQNKNNEIVFSKGEITSLERVQKSNQLWLFPNYSIGIELSGSTLNDLVKQRVRTVILLVILFNVLILFGVGFLFYNVRKELELAKIKSDFVSNVSHELRTPLAMISMYSETLMMDRLKNEEKRKEYYEIIHLETNRLNGIVNNILNFSRIENNKRKYSFTKHLLKDVIDEVIHVYKYELINKGFTFEVNVNNDLDYIQLDKDAVKDAVINLISNSIKYSEEIKHIEINVGEEGGTQFIEIMDKGIGISEKDQKQIFDKFYRVSEGNLAYKAQGSGLGLSIVKHIMEAHNGRVALRSMLGEGSSFKLIFPKNLKL